MLYKYRVGDCVVVGDFVSHFYGYNKEYGVVIDRYAVGPSNRRGPNVWYEIFVCGQVMPYLEKNLKNLNYQ